MKQKHKIFDCLCCNKPIYRLKGKASREFKLCGICVVKDCSPSNNSTAVIPLPVQEKSIVGHSGKYLGLIQEDFEARCLAVEQHLIRTKELHLIEPNLTFVDCWLKTKEKD